VDISPNLPGFTRLFVAHPTQSTTFTGIGATQTFCLTTLENAPLDRATIKPAQQLRPQKVSIFSVNFA
jgi:hypothetical protein